MTLEIRNAFNKADWKILMKCLNKLSFSAFLVKETDSYLYKRCVVYNANDTIEEERIIAELLQGYYGGPP